MLARARKMVVYDRATPRKRPKLTLIHCGIQQTLFGGRFQPVTKTYSTTGTFTETIPNGATTAIVEVWGSTGAGGLGTGTGCTISGGGGGASGSYCRTSYNCAAQNAKTLTVFVDSGSDGASSTVTAGTATGFTTMTAHSGVPGSNGPAGAGAPAPAIATGGTQANTAGNAGVAGGLAGGLGGAGLVGVNGTGNDGGHGGKGASNVGRTIGLDGLVIIRYT